MAGMMRFHLPLAAVMFVRLVLAVTGLSEIVNGCVGGNDWLWLVGGLCLAAIPAVQVKPRKRASRGTARGR
jgi:hypothetical protein